MGWGSPVFDAIFTGYPHIELMVYKQHGDCVTLEMSRDQYQGLMLMLGGAICVAQQAFGPTLFHRWMEFVNELNAENPNYTPFEISSF